MCPKVAQMSIQKFFTENHHFKSRQNWPSIWAAFGRKFVTKTFQKLFDLVKLATFDPLKINP